MNFMVYSRTFLRNFPQISNEYRISEVVYIHIKIEYKVNSFENYSKIVKIFCCVKLEL